MPSATREWLRALKLIQHNGYETAPRGMATLEVAHLTTVIDMSRPVLCVPERKLSYRFMAAEALWILEGSNAVEEIAPWNSRMREYSDDGETLWGAYGPRVIAQLDYVVEALRRDVQSRQAVMTLWRPFFFAGPADKIPISKDVPCTVALTFRIRQGQMDCHAFMRSNDLWLGWPYDVFSFSMVAAMVALLLPDYGLRLGTLYHTAASSHLYKTDLKAVTEMPETETFMANWAQPYLNLANLDQSDPVNALKTSLRLCRDTLELPPNGFWDLRPLKIIQKS